VNRNAIGLVALVLVLGSSVAAAQTDEIQVYDGSLAPPGVFNLTVHNNYAIHGVDTPAFPGALVSDHTLSGVAEWAWGINRWFEAGLYMPLYSDSSNEGATFDGVKGRALFAVPNAETRKFFYGVNFEFSYNEKQWDEKHYTSEIRPIVGWHFFNAKVDLVFNPILDNNFEGTKDLDFAPSTRVAYNVSSKWAVAFEEYDDFGPVKHFVPNDERTHEAFAVVDYSSGSFELEGGIGFGETPASDDTVVKLIFSKDLRMHDRT
jgi:opacity protein-like surface antigen